MTRLWACSEIGLTLILASYAVDAAVSRPSFDCAKATSVAEKMICADPALGDADAAIAANYTAALQRLDAPARKALAQDQEDFIDYRDRIAGFDEGVPKDKQNFPIDEFMHDRAIFLASIERPGAGFVGTWKNVGGEVKIKSVGAGKLEVGAESANPATGGSVCDVGGVVRAQNALELIDADDNDKPTGFVYRFRRLGDALMAEEAGEGKGGLTQPPSCGANGHVSGAFFLTRPKS
jgi:uncharacterized protein YecT (DUF1311 family)